MQLDFSLAGPCATVDKCHLAAHTNSFRLMVVMRIVVFCVIVVLTFEKSYFVFCLYSRIRLLQISWLLFLSGIVAFCVTLCAQARRIM